MRGILYAAAEGLPFIKSGGLADVIGSLPQRLDRNKYQVAVVMPAYKRILEKFDLEKILDYPVQSGLINTTASLYHTVANTLDFYFIREDGYFWRDNMYGYADDGERFAFFSKAVLELLPHLPFRVEIIHEHDWHTGMIPVLAKHEYHDEYVNSIRHVYTIHNLLFQGSYPESMLNYFNLDREYFNNGSIRFNDGINFMKAGIEYADKITTVSNTYAGEILTDEYGERLNGSLNYRKDDLWGIVNGIDTDMWDPATDPYIHAHYNDSDLSGKAECKRYLQQSLGLRVADDVLLVGLVSRLTWQKGASIILEKLNRIMGQDIQFVILGSGDSYIESRFKSIEGDYPHRAVFYCGYDEPLSHSIYAGCDLFLMPSLFEPCGISQLISMRYGTLPLVRETGGLKDTVIPYNYYDKSGTGFSFANFSGDDLMCVLSLAIDTYYYHRDDWTRLMHNAMNTDVSWDKSAELYDQCYSML